MEATALVAFFLDVPQQVFSVELLGSWDNFTKPYRMQRDRLRGRGVWTGVYSFDQIIFDGDNVSHRPRDGALKQGGRYWYYYRLNDETEYYDPAQTSTTLCPILPGQEVNVLDVAREMIEPASRARSASVDYVSYFRSAIASMTLDPEDRYRKVERPSPSKLLRHYNSFENLKVTKVDGTADHALPSPPGSSAKAFGPNSFTGATKPNGRPGSRHGLLHDHLSQARNCNVNESTNSLLKIAYGLGITTEKCDDVEDHIEPGRAVQPPASYHATTCDPMLSHAGEMVSPVASSDVGSPDMEGLMHHPSPLSECVGFDLTSPTFTADTISTAGFETPDRLSLQVPQSNALAFLPAPDDDHRGAHSCDDSLSHVSERLSRLMTADETASDDCITHLDQGFAESDTARTAFFHCNGMSVLNNADAASSELTLKKLPTPQPVPMILDNNLLSFSNGALEGRDPRSSFVDAVFGELDYLRDMIA